ncbi:MAG: hypothetical protein QOH54_5366 [Mycobacterium sp.]|jgi:hypothetical protein|nr:hypothetical protein [Mycobacterium sp.]
MAGIRQAQCVGAGVWCWAQQLRPAPGSPPPNRGMTAAETNTSATDGTGAPAADVRFGHGCVGVALVARTSHLRHLPVLAPSGEQLGVAAALHDAPRLHHQDHVGVTDGRKPVRDDETGPVAA